MRFLDALRPPDDRAVLRAAVLGGRKAVIENARKLEELRVALEQATADRKRLLADYRRTARGAFDAGVITKREYESVLKVAS